MWHCSRYLQGQARGYGRITRQNLVFQQHLKPEMLKDGSRFLKAFFLVPPMIEMAGTDLLSDTLVDQTCQVKKCEFV